MTTARTILAAVAIAAVAAIVPGASAPAASPPLEPIEIRHLPVPERLDGMSEVDWLPGSRELVIVIRSSRYSGNQLAVVGRNGRGLRCISCGLDPTDITGPSERPIGFGKPIAFADGERVLMRLGIQPGQPGAETQNFVYAILECGPSVADCERRELVPLNLPGGGIAQGVQNREARVSPDGRWVAWTEVSATGVRMSMGRLQRSADSYSLSGIRVLNPDVPLDDDSNHWRLAGAAYEFKNFSADGRHAYYSSMRDAENFDTWRLDLRTGERDRLTRQIEWDEDVSDSPGDGSLSQYSSRGFDRMTVLAQLPRPPIIDSILFTWTGRFMLNQQNRHCLLEPWLMSPDGQRGGYFGQPVNPALEPDWDSRTLGAWSPDGTRLAFWESRVGAANGDDEPVSRVVVARLTARGPVDHRPHRTPRPAWAPTREQFDGFQSNTGTYVVPGRASGTATVTLEGTLFSGVETVVYDEYSDDGRSVLNGVESIDEASILSGADWHADLTLSGEHRGYLRADIAFAQGGLATGEVSSEYDGRIRSTLPPPTCDPLPTPRLRAGVRRGTGGDRLVVEVRSRIVEDPRARPVRGALVTAGGESAHTNDRGVARLPKWRESIRVTAAGFRPVRIKAGAGR